MLCSSMKLTDRRDFKQDTTPKRNKSTMLEEKLFMKSDYYHSYTFRWDKPKKHHYSCNNPQFLTIKELTFPEHLSRRNDDPSKIKPVKRTPPTRPNISPTGTFEPRECEREEISINIWSDRFSKETEDLIEEIKSSVCIEEEDDDIDPDIQQLILSTRESENEKPEEIKGNERKRKRKKKKGKSGEKEERKKEENEEEDEEECEEDQQQTKKEKKKTKTKVISFSLSKPPTPQTLQVIRVDVTSTFSMEEDILDTTRTDSNLSDCSKGCSKKILKNKEIKDNLHKQATLAMDIGTNEVNLMCRRLTLKDRNDENGYTKNT